MLIDELEKLWKATTPGEWNQESKDSRSREGAYEAVEAEDGKALFDTANSAVSEIHNEPLCRYWDETGRKNFEFIVAAHNSFPKLAEQFRALLKAVEDAACMGDHDAGCKFLKSGPQALFEKGRMQEAEAFCDCFIKSCREARDLVRAGQ